VSVCVFTLYVKVIIIKLIKFKFDNSFMNLTMCLIYKMNQLTSK